MAELGHDAPPGFYEKPEIEPHLAMIWDAFWELSTERQIGMVIGPIPTTKIREYLHDELGLKGIDYDHARTIIRRADEAWLGMLNLRKDDGPEMSETVHLADSQGVKRLVRGLARSKQK